MEIWKPVKNWENDYEVSSLGRVRNKETGYIKKGTVTKPSKGSSGGYLVASLQCGGRKQRFFVHRLVAVAFIANPDGKRTINHKNGDKKDNTLENLEWATHGENNKHAWETGLCLRGRMPTGERAPKPLQAMNLATGEVCEFASQRKAARALGLLQSAIFQCRISPETRKAGIWQFCFSS